MNGFADKILQQLLYDPNTPLLFNSGFFVYFLFFFILYKWIPEKRIHAGAALIAAFFSALLWELLKRAYTYYLVHVSVLRKIESPIVAIILFGFWMELTMGIMLYGAKFTFLLDKEENDKPKKTH